MAFYHPQHWQPRQQYKQILSDTNNIKDTETLFAYLLFQVGSYLQMADRWNHFLKSRNSKIDKNDILESAAILGCQDSTRAVASKAHALMFTWPVHILPLLTTQLKILKRASKHLEFREELLDEYQRLERSFPSLEYYYLNAEDILYPLDEMNDNQIKLEYLEGERNSFVNSVLAGKCILVLPETG